VNPKFPYSRSTSQKPHSTDDATVYGNTFLVTDRFKTSCIRHSTMILKRCNVDCYFERAQSGSPLSFTSTLPAVRWQSPLKNSQLPEMKPGSNACARLELKKSELRDTKRHDERMVSLNRIPFSSYKRSGPRCRYFCVIHFIQRLRSNKWYFLSALRPTCRQHRLASLYL
jgi:hypothetical protein